MPLPRLTTIDGESIDLSVLRGRKAVYLKFWATWCSPCRKQMPHFENVSRTADDELEVIGVNIGFDDTVEQIKSYRRELGLTMPLVRDDDGSLAGLFGLRVTPQHVVIGKDGRIQYVGHLAGAELDAALARARRSGPTDGTPESVAQAAAAPQVVRIGGVVPAAKLRTLDEDEVVLKDPAGKRRSVLAFLSPWCEEYFKETRPQSSAQCRALREQLVASGRDRSVRWVVIASGLWASEQDLRDYRDKHGIPVPMTLDRNGALFRRFGVHRVPTVIVVDAEGRVVRRIEVGERGKLSGRQPPSM